MRSLSNNESPIRVLREVSNISRKHIWDTENTKIYLKNVFDNVILKEKIIWNRAGPLKLSTRLEKYDITADLFPGGEDEDTLVCLTKDNVHFESNIKEYRHMKGRTVHLSAKYNKITRDNPATVFTVFRANDAKAKNE